MELRKEGKINCCKNLKSDFWICNAAINKICSRENKPFVTSIRDEIIERVYERSKMCECEISRGRKDNSCFFFI